MSTNSADVFDALCVMLASVGYTFQDNISDPPETVDEDELRGHWFAWAAPGMADCETGETHASYTAAVQGAAAHWFANARIPVDCAEPPNSVALMSFDLQRLVE